MNKIKQYLFEIIEVMRKPGVSVLPGHLSFFLLISSVPIVLIFCIIANIFSLSYTGLIDFINESFPDGVSKLIVSIFNKKIPDISLIFLIFSSIFLTSRATKSVILTANSIYGVNRNSFYDFIKSIIVTILFIILFVFMIVIVLLGGKILELINNIPQIGFVSKNIITMIGIFRIPIALVVIYFFIKLIYLLTPNKRIGSKSVSAGAAFTTINWFLLTYLYSFYVTNYSSYDTYYGNASNLIILMLWIYIISNIFVVGMVINLVQYKRNNNM